MVKIGKPIHARNPNHTLSVVASSGNVLIRRYEVRGSPFEAIAQPDLVAFNQRENLFVSNGILMPDNQELLIILHQLRHVFAEERKGRIGHHDVCLAQKVDALLRAEVARLQLREHILVVPNQDFHVGHVHRAVAVHVFHLRDDQFMGDALRFFGVHLGKERKLRALNGRAVVAGADKFLQPQLVEARGKIFEEIAFVGVVAVAEYRFAAKVLPIVLQLALDVFVLRVKLVLLRRLCSAQILVCHKEKD